MLQGREREDIVTHSDSAHNEVDHIHRSVGDGVHTNTMSVMSIVIGAAPGATIQQKASKLNLLTVVVDVMS